jgi:hypothetical protein
MDSKYTVVQSSDTYNFYRVSIVLLIIISTSAHRHKKQKNKNKNKLFHVQIKILVGRQIFRGIRRIEKHIPILAVEWMSQWKTDITLGIVKGQSGRNKQCK